MNKQELVKKISEKTEGVSLKQIDSIVGAFTETVGDALAEGEKVQLVGFGNFETRERAARQGRNPRKPEEIIEIPATKAPAFKAGKVLKEKVNK